MYPPANAPALDNRLQAIRKTTVAFASLFKNIPFIKYQEDGTELERIFVPILYGNKEKYVKRLDIPDEKVQITLPRIEYGLVSMEYDPSRRTNQANKIVGCSADGSAYVNSPSPYNFNFEIVLYTRNIEDANQIMEYILPFFVPDYNLKINMVPEVGIIKNISITFTGESNEEDATGSYDSPIRSVFRTLTFTARSYLFQPPKYYKPILQAETNLYQLTGVETLALANGTGTFIPGDFVFQGSSYDRPYAKAKVIGWNPSSNVLTIANKTGNFTANSTLYNTDRTTQFMITSANNSTLMFNSTITPVPNTYPVTGPFEYNIQTHEY
jgi:hypothetical protein